MPRIFFFFFGRGSGLGPLGHVFVCVVFKGGIFKLNRDLAERGSEARSYKISSSFDKPMPTSADWKGERYFSNILCTFIASLNVVCSVLAFPSKHRFCVKCHFLFFSVSFCHSVCSLKRRWKIYTENLLGCACGYLSYLLENWLLNFLYKFSGCDLKQVELD